MLSLTLLLVLPATAKQTWEQAEYNWTEEEFTKLLGAWPTPKGKTYPTRKYEPTELPESYDVLDAYPNCSHFVNDQSVCGSCWAVSTGESITDRLCIAGHGDIRISAADILTCCGEVCGSGCNGGWPAEAWEYMTSEGIVDGGVWGTTDHCTSYPFQPCGHHTTAEGLKPCGPSQPTPKCFRGCENGETWYGAKIKNTQHVYGIIGEQDMMVELIERGPYTVAFSVFSDFMKYKGGIYQKSADGKYLGGHAIELTGFGVEEIDGEKVKYWKLKNSWNTSWGEEGYFRFLRGVNECGIEEEGFAANVEHAVIPSKKTKTEHHNDEEALIMA